MSETQTPVSEDFMRSFLELQRKVADISNTGVGKQFTTGDLIPAIGTTRAGALLCDGATYTRATYPALSAVCITIPALIGDGSTTFTVPDYRGQALAGADAATFVLGAAVGVQTVTLTAAQSGQPAGTTTSTTPGSTGAGTAHTHGIAAGALTGDFTTTGGAGGAVGSPAGQGTGTGTYALNRAGTTQSEAAHTHPSAAHTHTIAAANAASAHSVVQPTLPANIFIVI